jgi:hypothetical protein
LTAVISLGKIAEQFGEDGRQVRRRLPQAFTTTWVGVWPITISQ